MNPCVDCDGRCCLSHIVGLTHYDVERLRLLTGKDPLDFIGFVSVDKVSLHHHDVRLNDGYHYMILQRDSACRCIFLDLENRCSVHSHRPMVCKTYPFQLLSEHPFEIEYSAKSVCPTTWRIGYRQRGIPYFFHKREAERREYARVNELWNKREFEDRSPDRYLEYLTSVESSEDEL